MNRPRLRRETDSAGTVLMTLGGLAALTITVVALLARQLDSSWQPLIIVGALSHQLMWAAPPAVVLLVISRRWWALGAAGVTLLLAVMTQLPLYVGSDAPPHVRTLTVLQANLKVGAAEPTNVVDLVGTHHVDVLMTEELTTTERGRLVHAGLTRTLPHVYDAALAGGGGGLAIWSRYPLTPEHNFPGFELGVLQASLQLDRAHSVTVLAAHLLPPYPYPSAEWISEITRLRSVLAAAARPGIPVVLAGDLNATTDNAQFRDLLANGYTDAAEDSGAGYLSTYPTDRWLPPVIAIDHVLSRDATARDATTLDLPGSDHRALLVQMDVAEDLGGA